MQSENKVLELKINKLKNKYLDKNFFDIIMFFVINTPFKKLSSRAITLQDRGWGKLIWKKDILKNELNKVLDLDKNNIKNVLNMVENQKDLIKNLSIMNLDGDFHKKIYTQRAIYVKDNTEKSLYMGLFKHIRNSLAHGRFNVYDKGYTDAVFLMEDRTSNNKITARIIIYRSTLLKFIEILSDSSIEKEEIEKKEMKKYQKLIKVNKIKSNNKIKSKI